MIPWEIAEEFKIWNLKSIDEWYKIMGIDLNLDRSAINTLKEWTHYETDGRDMKFRRAI